MLDNRQIEFLTEILRTNSPSGYEKQLMYVIKGHMDSVCSIKTDCIGNLYMYSSNKGPMTVMISAHADEVGFQIADIDNNGFVYARNIASPDKQTISGNIVTAITKNGEIQGVIGKKPPHIIEYKERDKCLGIEDLWIDFGFETKVEAESHVERGDYITLFSEPRFTSNNNRIISKALDNKIGIFIMSEVMRRICQLNIPLSVVGVATVQEELGCRGSIVSSNIVVPDVAFCIDVGISTDIPNISSKNYGLFDLGKGVGIIRNADNNEFLTKTLVDTANTNGISYQKIIGHRSTGGTEASHIQLSQQGVVTANISVPNRYMHSLVEMCDLRDVESAINLLVAEMQELTKYNKSDFYLF